MRPESFRLRDLIVFAAVVNIHYPILELLRVQFSYGLLPIQFAMIAGFALITRRLRVLRRAAVYVALAVAYFLLLSVIEVGFVPLGAYVVIMQTATAIVFIDYLLSLGREGARSVVRNFQRALAIYVLVFALLQILVRATHDPVLFEQVAGSNYVGLLTTYLLVSVMRRRHVAARGWALTVLALAVNLLGQQRASFLLNIVTAVKHSILLKRVVVVTVLAFLTAAYVFAGDRIAGTLSPLRSSAAAYWALIPLGFANLEEITRHSAVTPDSGYDTSLLLRAISMVYIGSQVLSRPMLPVASGGADYLAISHNLPLEYFKVGGLGFFILSAVMLLIRYRKLLTRGYFSLDSFGILMAVAYSMLFNDLFLGFLLLPLRLETTVAKPSRPKRLAPATRRLATFPAQQPASLVIPKRFQSQR